MGLNSREPGAEWEEGHDMAVSGFQVEGMRRSSLLVDGKYVDEYFMSLIHGS